MTTPTSSVPRGTLGNLAKYARNDVLSGFLVFLIALPLCLGISLASGYPAIAGVFTAIVGGLLTPWLSNSELTIKGPAAGLIVIALGAITEMGAIYGPERAYSLALGISVVAGLVQIGFAIGRSGALGEFFPTSVVHGMLAAIGVIIISKQAHITLGVTDVKGDPLYLLSQIPNSITRLNPEIAIIGIVSLLILFLMPFVKNKYLRMIPTPMLVILVSVPLGMYFDLSREHTYSFVGQQYALGEKFLVTVPNNLLKAITFPDFSALQSFAGWKWVVFFALIGSLESILSAKAVDLIDPYKRKTNMNRDLLAVGLANTVAASIGGLPMISEIVRSKANVDNGAKTRFANMFHSLFLLGFVALVPGLIHKIPLAALSAMLVYTGFRLASPREFINVSKIGKEQLIIFLVTIFGVLATDLLVGVALGIFVKFIIHTINGVPLGSLFKPFLDIEPQPDGSSIIKARGSAIFSNWIPFKRQLEELGLGQKSNLVVDLSQCKLVDHSVMEKLHELQEEFEHEGLTLELIGLETHKALSEHLFSARRWNIAQLRKVTVLTLAEHAEAVVKHAMQAGASGYSSQECDSGSLGAYEIDPVSRISKIEFLVPSDRYERLVSSLNRDFHVDTPLVAYSEKVESIREPRPRAVLPAGPIESSAG